MSDVKGYEFESTITQPLNLCSLADKKRMLETYHKNRGGAERGINKKIIR